MEIALTVGVDRGVLNGQGGQVIYLGKQAALLSDASSKALTAAVPGLAISTAHAAIRAIGAGGHTGKTTTFWHSQGESEPAIEVVLHSRAEACSRHNSSGRPDDISDCLESAFGSSANHTRFAVLLAVDTADEAFAAGCASARAAHWFSVKNGASEVTDNWSTRQLRIHFILENAEQKQLLSPRLPLLSQTIKGIRNAARLVDMPCSMLNTDAFVTIASEIHKDLKAKGHPVEIEVIRPDAESKFGGLWGVGKAAVSPPALVVLSYKPQNAKRTLAFVGKGIVYDTGGLSIKPRDAMIGMKRDMGGAAAILFAFEVLVKNTSSDNVHALLCLAENAVGPKSTRPDDILRMLSGKTVEVNNTDAEGRLVLADGVHYASKHLNPDIIVDMATLTGAQGIATGVHHAALYCDDEGLEKSCLTAGRRSGDLCHALPFAPEFFFREFKSKVADMKNSVACRTNAQSSCAGEFIRNHIAENYKGSWMHIDIAYPAESGERGTGFGVALLVQLFHQILN
ncbi:Cytosol aminopeptidase domain-containing protein [Plasmodiophora brassicae]